METRALYFRAKNGVERNWYVCGWCGRDAPDMARADLCCTTARCADCGMGLWKIDPDLPVSGRCAPHLLEFKIIQRVLNSEIVPYVEGTPLYVEPAPVSSDEDDREGRFYGSIGDLRKVCGGRPLPLFAAPCLVERWPGLDATWILEDALQDFPDEDPIEGVRNLVELRAFIEQWNEKQSLDSWVPVEGQIVLVDDASPFRTTERIAAELRRRFAERGT